MSMIPLHSHRFSKRDLVYRGRLRQRRAIFGLVTILSILGLLGLMASALSPGGLEAIDWVLIALFATTLPWTVIGFWNAVIGLAIMRTARDATALVAGDLKGLNSKAPITAKTAILSCIRNEDPVRVMRNLEVMIENLVATGSADRFEAYVLSDTNWDDLIAEEEAAVSRLKAHWAGRFSITYRRRSENSGFKAGNIRDFLELWGDDHDFALVLDADSYMSAETILRLIRVMQANPNLGILQSLIAGLPATSPFARVFQFGMRLGMRSYTIGSAWWQGDCGPYWGHNAAIRIKPFKQHCDLPKLAGNGPLGGDVLSHDQVEAVLMRRAGYQVRVIPVDGGSYEENPPNLMEFMRRDLRWCQGNMQYGRLIGLPGLKLLSRVQLVLAMLMFIGSLAWMSFIFAAGIALPHLGTGIAPLPGLTLMATILTMIFAPKFATIIDVLVRKDLARAFGGRLRMALSSIIDILFSMLLAPIMAVAHSIFIIGLFFGRRMGWPAQRRSAHTVGWGEAAVRLWPQTLFGAAGLTWFYNLSPELILPSLPVLVGPLIAVLFAVATSVEPWGRRTLTAGLWRTPEETAPSADLRELGLPALAVRTGDDRRPALITAGKPAEDVSRAA